MPSDTADPTAAVQLPPRVESAPQVLPLDNLVCRIQNYTKDWPEPLRYSHNAHIAATDTDQGFERLLREAMEVALPFGHTSGIRDLGMGDGRTPAIVRRHELDLILRCREGRLAIEAKAWREEVDKDAVIIFLAKVLDFMAMINFEPLGPVYLGFIGLHGFSEAALRIIFACGIIPFTKRTEQLSYRFLDSLLLTAATKCQERGWSDREHALRAQRAALTPFVAQEGKDLSQIFLFEPDSAIVDLEGIRRASEMFDEARVAHRQAVTSYREFRRAIQVDRA